MAQSSRCRYRGGEEGRSASNLHEDLDFDWEVDRGSSYEEDDCGDYEEEDGGRDAAYNMATMVLFMVTMSMVMATIAVVMVTMVMRVVVIVLVHMTGFPVDPFAGILQSVSRTDNSQIIMARDIHKHGSQT